MKNIKYLSKTNNLQLTQKSGQEAGFLTTTFPPDLEYGFAGLMSRWRGIDNRVPNIQSTAFYMHHDSPIFVNFTWSLLLDVVNKCPHLALILNRRASMFANAKFGVAKIGSDEIDYNHPFLKLLKNPNCMQTGKQWLKEYSILTNIFGISLIYKLKIGYGEGQKIAAFKNLVGGQTRIIPTGNFLNQFEKKDIIKNITYWLCQEEHGIETQIPIDPDDVIINFEYATNLKAKSKIEECQQQINNLIGSAKSRSKIIYERGANGIISSFNKDNAGGVPLQEDEKKRIEKEYLNNYGVEDWQRTMILTNSALNFIPMTFDSSKLLLLEGEIQDFHTVCGALGMDSDLFPEVKGATYENKAHAEKMTYDGTIQDEVDTFCEQISTDNDCIKLIGEGYELRGTFDHLACMQDDRDTEMNVMANITNTIIQLNQAVSAGAMTREAAISVLVNIYRMTPETSKALISEKQKEVAAGNDTNNNADDDDENE